MRFIKTLSGLALGIAAAPAFAQELPVIGRPVDKLISFQPAATELARDIHWLDSMLFWIITVIVLFVTALMVYSFIRFNRRANPVPAKFTHNTPIEILWTLVPIIILVVIGAFSLPVLFKQQTIPEGEVVVKVTGNQWYWNYEYVGEEVAFDSFLIDGSTKVEALGEDQPFSKPQVLDDVAVSKLEALGYSREDFLLATDTAIVLPIGKTVVMQITAADVIHSWTIPAFGVKQDAVPGRIAQLWFKPEIEGVFYGQCSELCGKDHAYMPITVKVVSEAKYAEWLAASKAAGGFVPLASNAQPGTVQVAANN